MTIQPMVNIHNRFHVVVTNAATNEVEQEAFGENLVLDRMYDQLLSFGSYFTNIVFGAGPATPTPLATTRDELFSRIGYKAATEVELIRDYPMSTWTKKIRLGTGEFNNNSIAEVGISETTTKINTHAMLKDAGGALVSIAKTSTVFIDIFCTVYVTLYNVDHGLFWYGTGLRDYLAGGATAPTGDILGISYLNDAATLKGSRTKNNTNRTITLTGTFDEEAFNQEVKHIDWESIGLRCVMPRTGVFTGVPKTGIVLGTADGVTDLFALPQVNTSGLVIKVGGAVNTDWTRQVPYNMIRFNPIPASGVVTADYTCLHIPKDMYHALEISMTLNFGVTQAPTAVMTTPSYPVTIPAGSMEPPAMKGDYVQGFFGEASAANLITGPDLASYLGLTSGSAQNNAEGWLKLVLGGRLMFVAKKTFRYNLSWNNINAAAAIYGEKQINIGGNIYAIKLLTSLEWDLLIQPVHKDGIGPRLYNYTDAELNITGNGGYTWTSTPSGSSRVVRGNSSVGSSYTFVPSYTGTNRGWRPVLEFIASA